MKKSLRFGVIGVGRFGRHYVRLLQDIKGAKLRAVSHISQKYEEEVSCLLPKEVKQYQELAGMLRDPDLDAVIIATPASTHFELAKRALESGKHVLVEKPMVTSITEAEALREIVGQSSKVFMVGHQFVYHDYLQYLRKELEKGIFGKIKNIKAEHMYPGPGREDVGVFWDAAPHEFAILDFLLGPSSIKKVSGKKKYTFGKQVEDQVFAEIEFADGVNFELILSSTASVKIRRMELWGDKGSAFFDDMEVKDKLKLHWNGQYLTPEISAGEPLRNQLGHFIYCVSKNQRPFTDIEHGIRVVRALDKTYQNLV
jgi:predicted dehydrogenase